MTEVGSGDTKMNTYGPAFNVDHKFGDKDLTNSGYKLEKNNSN